MTPFPEQGHYVRDAVAHDLSAGRSSPAQRGRGTARSVVEGADARTVSGVAPSTASRSPSPVSLRCSGEDFR